MPQILHIPQNVTSVHTNKHTNTDTHRGTVMGSQDYIKQTRLKATVVILTVMKLCIDLYNGNVRP